MSIRFGCWRRRDGSFFWGGEKRDRGEYEKEVDFIFIVDIRYMFILYHVYEREI